MTPTPTDHEIEFIAGLGRWSAAGSRTPRRELLYRYIEAASLRVRWEEIDPEAAVAFARAVLRQRIASRR